MVKKTPKKVIKYDLNNLGIDAPNPKFFGSRNFGRVDPKKIWDKIMTYDFGSIIQSVGVVTTQSIWVVATQTF